MGKSQKKRAMRRHNPVRVPDSHLQHGLATAAASTSESKREAVVPVIEKLASQDVQERIWACAAVSNLIQNDSSTRRLLQGKNVVGALIARLSDNVEEVVVEAAGALRNLCIDGGYEICAEMFNKGILAPLKEFVPKISSVLGQIFTDPKSVTEATRFVYEFAENVITLFWCLSETSSKALNAVNQLNLVPFLMAFLDPQSRDKLPITTLTAAAQCLYVLTEENPPAADEIRAVSAYITCLIDIARGDVKLSSKPNSKVGESLQSSSEVRVVAFKTLVCGILRNIQPLPILVPAASIDIDRTIILPFLLPLLTLDPANSVETVQSLLSTQEKEVLEKQQVVLKNGAKTDHKTKAEVELERIESELRAVKLALELITGICAELPDPEEGDEDEEIEEEDDEEEWESDREDDITMEHELVADGEPTQNGVQSREARSIDLVASIVPPCIKFIQPTPLSYPPSFQPSPHPPTTSALIGVHIAALECLNNISLSIAELGLPPSSPSASAISQQMSVVWDAVWSLLASIGVPETGGIATASQQRMQIWNISLGVLWAVARIRRGDPHLIPQEERVRVLMQMADTTQEEDIKVMCLGILECLAMNPDPAHIVANKVISEYILSYLPNSGISGTSRPMQPEVIIQAASSMIDIFSDEDSPWDVNFRQGKWEVALRKSVDGVRKAIRSIDRRKEGGLELRRRGDEVLENLTAFIKYRKGLKL